MPTFSRVRRKRGPALAWVPSQDTYYELAQILRSEGRLPLYLTQAAILEFEAHLSESALPLPFGLLAGDLCICPDTKLEYLLIDTVARARIELGQDDPYAQLGEELRSLGSEQAKQRKVAIGWYMGGLADDLTLDDDVTRLHGELFPERWQVALVRGAASGAERGAFLRYESIWSRWYSIPFFEFLAGRAGHRKGEVRTAIRWTNYRTDEPTHPLDEFDVSVQRSNAVPRRSWGSRLFGASLEPLHRAARGTSGRAPERAQAKSAPERQELPSAPPSQLVAPASAPRPTVIVPPLRAEPLEINPPPRRPPEPQRVESDERKVAAQVDRTVAAPIEQSPMPRVEQIVATSIEQNRAARPEEKAATAPELRVAPTTELKVASIADLRVAAPAEVKVVEPAEVSVAAMVRPAGGSSAEPDVALDAPSPEVQHVFIDGGLVPAPLAYEFTQKPGMLPGADRVRMSSLVVGALLLLILVLLYLIAS